MLLDSQAPERHTFLFSTILLEWQERANVTLEDRQIFNCIQRISKGVVCVCACDSVLFLDKVSFDEKIEQANIDSIHD